MEAVNDKPGWNAYFFNIENLQPSSLEGQNKILKFGVDR